MVRETSEEYSLTVWIKDMATKICVSGKGDTEAAMTNTT